MRFGSQQVASTTTPSAPQIRVVEPRPYYGKTAIWGIILVALGYAWFAGFPAHGGGPGEKASSALFLADAPKPAPTATPVAKKTVAPPSTLSQMPTPAVILPVAPAPALSTPAVPAPTPVVQEAPASSGMPVAPVAPAAPLSLPPPLPGDFTAEGKSTDRAVSNALRGGATPVVRPSPGSGSQATAVKKPPQKPQSLNDQYKNGDGTVGVNAKYGAQKTPQQIKDEEATKAALDKLDNWGKKLQ